MLIPAESKLSRLRGPMMCLTLAFALLLGGSDPSLSRSGDRTLKLYFAHTGEHGEFTFRRNGRYDQRELKRLNYFLRDWRADEPTDMDPRLFDLVWEVYQEVGAQNPVTVVSAFRSLKTNNMLRKRSSGVAKRSQHTAGKAMDFFIPGVPLEKLRKIALRKQVGGVGYYPTSGSPFVHLDVGSVRHWPRMTRQQLLALFPDGKTLHIPSDGKPLPGYKIVLAEYGRSGKKETLGTSRGSSSSNEKATVVAWLKNVFDGDEDEGDQSRPMRSKTAPARALAPVQTARSAPQEIQVASVAPQELSPPEMLPRAAPSAIRAIAVATRTETADPTASAAPQIAEQDTVGLLAYATMPQARPDGLPAAMPGTSSPEMAGTARLATAEDATELTALYERALANADPATASPRDAQATAGLVLANAVMTPSNSTREITLPAARPIVTASLGSEPQGFDAIDAAAGLAGSKTGITAEEDETLAYASPQERLEAPAALEEAAGFAIPQETPLSLAATVEMQAPAAPVARLITQKPDAGDLSRLMGKDTTRTFIFALLQAPRPSGAVEFFAIPVNEGVARAISKAEQLRTDRFATKDDLAFIDEPDQVYLLVASLD
ncbi:uncharacterized protein YcbK (DUF882 family) [Rhodopseudomonas julia]|uniref:Murein endopeptidase K n=1 Tax=Rhodopseudomonas julia TaxID=200617 RepID=A0ABU0C798_9BRAD|nr:DUF882 domain-containing protein [Rhodopseudomonas julia]MDQ0326102.1 uncharacterized protein YcbK (DUF882 family) [Rhodopseudomonas julia]